MTEREMKNIIMNAVKKVVLPAAMGVGLALSAGACGEQGVDEGITSNDGKGDNYAEKGYGRTDINVNTSIGVALYGSDGFNDIYSIDDHPCQTFEVVLNGQTYELRDRVHLDAIDDPVRGYICVSEMSNDNSWGLLQYKDNNKKSFICDMSDGAYNDDKFLVNITEGADTKQPIPDLKSSIPEEQRCTLGVDPNRTETDDRGTPDTSDDFTAPASISARVGDPCKLQVKRNGNYMTYSGKLAKHVTKSTYYNGKDPLCQCEPVKFESSLSFPAYATPFPDEVK